MRESFKSLLMVFMFCMTLLGAIVASTPAQAQTTPPAQTVDPTVLQKLNAILSTPLVGTDPAPTKMTYDQWKQQFSNTDCWGCRLFSVMGQTTLDMGQQGSSIFSGPAINAVSAFMSLWVTWQLYLLLSVSHANSPAQSIDTIFNRLIVMLVVMFLLSSGRPYSFIMQGVLSSLGDVMSAASALLPASSGCTGGGGSAQFITKGNDLLCAMHQQMNVGMALGAFMVDSAKFSLLAGEFPILQVIGGAIIFAVFGFMTIIMPFRFFDALVRIATVAVIMPIVILAYLFKPTRGAVKQAATSLLAAALTFLFTAIAIAIAVKVLGIVSKPIIDGIPAGGGTPGPLGPLTASNFMVLITASIGMATMILQAGNIAQEFAGFQGNMGGAGAAGAAAAAGAVMLTAKYAGGGVGAVATKAGGALKAGTASPSDTASKGGGNSGAGGAST